MDSLFHNLFLAEAVSAATWVYLAFFAVATGYSVYTARQAAKLASQVATQGRQRGSLYQIRAGALPRRIPYGYLRLGAIETYVSAYGDNNDYLSYIMIWGEGPCEGLTNLLFDGQNVDLVPIDDDTANANILVAAPGSPWEGCVRFETELGTQDQPPHGREIIPTWGDVDTNILKGICYSWLELKFDPNKFPKGVPNISAILLGRNDIYDPRDSTYKYTNNSALCLNHYMTLQKLGPGLDYDTEIGEAELIAATNICEELDTVPSSACGGSSPSNWPETSDSSSDNSSGSTVDIFKYTFNGVVELNKTAEEIIDEFRTSMAGVTVYIGGRWRIYAGAYIVPTFEITKDMLVGPVRRRTRSGKRDRINKVRGVYSNVDTLWVPTDFPAVQDDAAITADGEELVEDIDLLNTDSPYRAQLIASIMLKKSRYGREVMVSCNIEAWRAQPGLTVLFHFPEIGFEHVPMDVNSMALSIKDRKMAVSLVLRETNIDVYEPPDLVCRRLPHPPGEPPDQPPPGGCIRYEDCIPEVPADITTQAKRRGGTLSVCGFAEFTDISSPPRYYKTKQTTGSLQIDKLYVSTICEGTYPGQGEQSGEFPVFYFFNEMAVGTVKIKLNHVLNGICSYTLVSADWRNRDAPFYLNRETTGWFIQVNGVNYVSPGYNFSVPVGNTITVAIFVSAISGYGIGAWYYEAGRDTFTDEWDRTLTYNGDCSVLTRSGTAKRIRPNSDLEDVPDRDGGVTNGTPYPVYRPEATLIVSLEPEYTEQVTSRVVRTLSGLECCPGTGFGVTSLQATGDLTEELLDEDTEEASIEEMQTAQPWSGIAWEPYVREDHQTEYTVRVSNEFDYFESKIQSTISGLAPNSTYMVKYNQSKKNIETGAITLNAGDLTYIIHTDENGDAVATVDLTTEVGYNYYIQRTTVHGG